MKIYFAPGSPAVDLGPQIEIKSRQLTAAKADGKQFFVLSQSDGRLAAEWILASFLSPLTIVPLAPTLPKEAREKALAQLPGDWIAEEDLPAPATQGHSKSPEEIWAVIFSSGSSGEPKGVALSGRALHAAAQAHAAHNGNSHWLLNLPLHHVGGFSVLSRAHFLGGEVSVSAARFDAQETVAWIEQGEVCGLSLVPTTLSRLLETKVKFESLETVLLGGAPAEPELVKRALDCGLPIRLTYGMTEHSSQIATEKISGTGMIPLPGVDVRIGAEGEILVRSACLASGLFRGGKLEPLPTIDGFFATGDLGRLDKGRLILEGRKSDMIITGGVKVFPQEIESLLTMPGLTDFAISSVPDKEWGERVCAALVGEISPDTVKSYLAEKIDSRKMPKLWVELPAIPRSATGKVLRSELRRLVQEKLNWANGQSAV